MKLTLPFRTTAQTGANRRKPAKTCVVLVGVFLCAFVSPKVFSQVIFSENTSISIRKGTVISIKEEVVHIKTDIQGEGTLLFSGSKEAQTIHTQNDPEISNLYLQNEWSVLLYGDLHINKNLYLARSTPLRLNDKLHLTDKENLKLDYSSNLLYSGSGAIVISDKLYFNPEPAPSGSQMLPNPPISVMTYLPSPAEFQLFNFGFQTIQNPTSHYRLFWAPPIDHPPQA